MRAFFLKRLRGHFVKWAPHNWDDVKKIADVAVKLAGAVRLLLRLFV